LRTAKLTSEIFVSVDIYLLPSRLLVGNEKNTKISIKDLLQHTENHISLLGQPGAGKTTSMKFIALNELNKEKKSYVFFLKFRELNYDLYKENIILNTLSELFSLTIEVKNPDTDNKNLIENVRKQFIIKLLNEFEALLILDGFDEIPNSKLKVKIAKELSELFTKIQQTRIIVTSRTTEFNYSFERVEQYEIAPLSYEQIESFARKWLGDNNLSNRFLKGIKSSPFFDTAVRPINIAHLCAIFERTGKIPEKPKTIYKKIVNLLLEEWDEQRGINRNSLYSNFEIDRKFDFLSALAFELSVSKNTVFDTNNLREAFDNIHLDFGLKTNQRSIVIKEIESHTGLFVESGYDKFEFSHKSIQEYLCANYIVRLSTIPSNYKLICTLLNEFAIAVAIASRPSEYVSEFIINKLHKGYQEKRRKFGNRIDNIPIEIFINRLLLEKPDFNFSPQLAVTFLTLYSLYFESIYLSGRQLSLFSIDNLTTDFEKFLKLIIPKTSLEDIVSAYTNQEKIIVNDKEIIKCYLEEGKNKYISGSKGSVKIKLPKNIYISSDLIEIEIVQKNS